MAQNIKVAQPYANAFIQMASGKGSLDKVISDLTNIEAALESKDLVQALSNPLLSVEAKKSMIKSVFQGKIDGKSVNFLLVLCDRGRIDCLETINSLALQMAYKEASVEVATVVSASEMSESQQETLVKKLKSMANVKEVKLDIQTDKSLIGGFTVQIGSRIIDTSIQGQLKKLASHLGASSPE
jgi:F-type H+-transporting ATPase subunit delta